MIFFFFFSSRRRHTRYWRDWSSDVCSSDLSLWLPEEGRHRRCDGQAVLASLGQLFEGIHVLDDDAPIPELDRPSLLELAEGPRYRNTLAAYHGAQLLVSVVGPDAVAIAAHH